MGKRLGIFLMVAVLVGVFSFNGTSWAREQEVPEYEFLTCTAGNIQSFIGQLQAEKKVYEASLQEKYRDKPEKIAKNAPLLTYVDLIKTSEALLKQVRAGVSPESERAFMRLQRLHYGVLADLGGGKQPPKIGAGLIIGKNLAFGRLVLNVPNVIDPSYRLGSRLAEKEAAFLFKDGGKAPVTTEEMATMGAFEVSRLQPATNHSALSGKAPGNHYEAFLQEQTRLIRMQGKDLAKFDPTYARRVLFYDELKEDATSPKITAKDRFGLKWKVKWGDEVHTDVALTRIYIDLGGVYTDLKFYSGPGETILVLAKPDSSGPDAIKTYHELAAALLASKFKFHLDRYLLPNPVIKDKAGRVLGSGQVTPEMAERESIPAKYVGAYYVLVKECQVSLYNPAIRRLGGAALSKIGAPDDRVARSSLVFNCWIKNKDMKDDNSRTGMLFNPETQAFDRFVEFQSDLGCTLGALRPSGELNSFETSMIQLMPQSINFIMHPLYVPKAWKECTWSDARWMAMRIASLKREDLDSSNSDCVWPSYAQKVAVEKLINRRNELVKVFHLAADGFKEMPCDPAFTLTVNTKQGPDQPVVKGKINGNSKIVQELEATVHPEGLAKVVSRKND